MNWGRWINKDNETLFDLIFGCIVYSIVFEVIGLLVVENKGSYSMGLLLGTAVAVGLSVSMYKGLNRCLVMTEQKAGRSMALGSLFRSAVILLAAWIGMRSGYFSFPGIIIGILGLKISAHFHAYTNEMCIRDRSGRQYDLCNIRAMLPLREDPSLYGSDY